MLELFKKLFGSKPAETPAPYKVETPAPVVPDFPVEKAAKPKAEKKPTVKKATTRKPKTPKA
jgi:hypothetical protein